MLKLIVIFNINYFLLYHHIIIIHINTILKIIMIKVNIFNNLVIIIN